MTQLSAKLSQLHALLRDRPVAKPQGQELGQATGAPAPTANAPMVDTDEIKKLRLKIIGYEKKLAIIEDKLKEMSENG